MENSQRLRHTKLFAELNDEEMSALTRIVSIRSVAKNSVLFFEGDTATGFFVLISGACRIYKSSPEGREYTLHLVQPGQMFAEAAIFRGKGFPANCQATEDSEVAFIPKADFVALLADSPNIAMKMIGSLSAWLRDFTQQVENLSLKEIPARLAAYILSRSSSGPGNTFSLESSKTELAARLGTVIETLSRNFKKFKEIGAIEVNGKQITVLDIGRLQSIADGEKI